MQPNGRAGDTRRQPASARSLREGIQRENVTHDLMGIEYACLLLAIDYFSLSLGGVYYINYQKSAKAQLKRYPINLEPTTFKNVDSFEDIVNVVIAQLYANQSLNERFGNMISQSTRALKGVTQGIKTLTKKN